MSIMCKVHSYVLLDILENKTDKGLPSLEIPF